MDRPASNEVSKLKAKPRMNGVNETDSPVTDYIGCLR